MNKETLNIRGLLKDINVLLHIESLQQDYRFEYYTSAVKDPETGKQQLTRSYRLRDLLRGNVTQEPWDKFDLDKQTGLVTNLLELSGYKVVKMVTGWKVKCPSCSHLMEGKIWEAAPKTCRAKGCKQKIDAEKVIDIT